MFVKKQLHFIHTFWDTTNRDVLYSDDYTITPILFLFWGAPAASLRAATRRSGVGLATGYAVAPAAPARCLFFNGAGAAASLRSRPAHPSPGQALRQPLFNAE
ncbi:MAG: hypothetical protein NZM35_10525 [Chitinophagales bacterium]|nr:hypothetical protein [Chitinophagales bacterium]